MANSKRKEDEIFNKAIIILTRLTVVIALVITLAIGLSLGVQNMKISYEIEKLKQELKNLDSNNKEIYINISRKTNFVYLENIARHKLKMVPPKTIKYIYIKNKNLMDKKDE